MPWPPSLRRSPDGREDANTVRSSALEMMTTSAKTMINEERKCESKYEERMGKTDQESQSILKAEKRSKLDMQQHKADILVVDSSVSLVGCMLLRCF